MVYPALLPLPVVDWTDAPANLNGLVRFAERPNLVSARVPSHFKRAVPTAKCREGHAHHTVTTQCSGVYRASAVVRIAFILSLMDGEVTSAYTAFPQARHLGTVITGSLAEFCSLQSRIWRRVRTAVQVEIMYIWSWEHSRPELLASYL